MPTLALSDGSHVELPEGEPVGSALNAQAVAVRVDGDDELTEVQQEVLRTSVVVLDLDSGAVELVEQGGGAEAPPQARAA